MKCPQLYLDPIYPRTPPLFLSEAVPWPELGCDNSVLRQSQKGRWEMQSPGACMRAEWIFCLCLEFSWGSWSAWEWICGRGGTCWDQGKAAKNTSWFGELCKQRLLCTPLSWAADVGHNQHLEVISHWNLTPGDFFPGELFQEKKGVSRSLSEARLSHTCPLCCPGGTKALPGHPQGSVSELLSRTNSTLKPVCSGTRAVLSNDKNLFFPAPVKTEISESCKASQVCWSRLWLLLTR